MRQPPDNLLQPTSGSSLRSSPAAAMILVGRRMPIPMAAIDPKRSFRT